MKIEGRIPPLVPPPGKAAEAGMGGRRNGNGDFEKPSGRGGGKKPSVKKQPPPGMGEFFDLEA